MKRCITVNYCWPSPPQPPSPNLGRGGRKADDARILLPSPNTGRGAGGEGLRRCKFMQIYRARGFVTQYIFRQRYQLWGGDRRQIVDES